MGYIVGLLKYVAKGPFTNTVAFYIYGAGLLALLNATPHLMDGQFVEMAFDYFVTRYLPPTSLWQVIGQIAIGTIVAGLKWYLLTPRR